MHFCASMELEARAEGMLIGLATGDAVGLPREGLSPRRAARRFGVQLRHALLPGRGLFSDDTEHAFMTSQALLASNMDPARFARSLAWRLRGWLVAMPVGVGWATLRACLRLCVGVPPARSGVWSAGNGPLMRAPVIGFAAANPAARDALVVALTRMTHSDPLALEAARAVAEACAAVRTGVRESGALLSAAATPLSDPRWAGPLARLERALAGRSSPEAWSAAEGLANGASGYVLHTLPAVLVAWLRDPLDYAGTLAGAMALGGDTDTIGAIAGGLCGAAAGPLAIPPPLRAGLCDWPLSAARLTSLSRRLARLAAGAPSCPEPMPWRALMPLRNVVAAAVFIAHIMRRWLPPY